jgi:hypothetical protein
MSHPVTWFQISGSSGKKLQTFYAKVFGWNMTPGPASGDIMFVEREADGIPGGIVSSVDGSPSVAIYVHTDDIRAQLAKAERAGGKQVMDPMQLPNDMGTIAGFVDPAGNWIGLWSPGRSMTRSTAGSVTTDSSNTKRAARPKARAKRAPATAKRAPATAKRAPKTRGKTRSRKR